MRGFRRMGRMLALGLLGGGSPSLPYAVDFATLPDGALPSALKADATWAIVSGKLVETPTLGPNLLTNSGFETGNPPTGWTAVLGTLDSIADERTGGAGAVSLGVIRAGNNYPYGYQAVNAPIGTWLKIGGWVKRIDANQCSNVLTGSTHSERFYTDLVWRGWTDFECVRLASNILRGGIVATGADGTSGRHDDYAAQAITAGNLFAILDKPTQPNITVRVQASTTGDQVIGLVLRADSNTNPLNYILVRYHRTQGKMRVDKFLAGVPAVVLDWTNAGADDTPDVEARISGTTLQMFFNGAQKGADQTINEAAINNNAYHGIFSGGASGVNAFFCNSIVNRSIVEIGGSVTAGSAADLGLEYAALTNEWVRNQPPYYSFLNRVNSGSGGTGSWYGLVRLATDVVAYAPDVLTIDFAVNDADTAQHKATAEAFIRRLRTLLPNTRLLFMPFLLVANKDTDVTTNLKESVKQNWLTLCAHYGIPYVDVAAKFAALVTAGTYHMNELLNDGVHPKNLGHQIAHEEIQATVLSLLGSGAQWSGALPARLYDDGSYENEPIIRNGTDNNGETGVWSTVSTTQRQSAAAGATITWTGTFQSFDLDTLTAPAGVLAWSVDGGAETQINCATWQNVKYSVWSGARAEHTVTVRVISGTVTIKRFLAI
jgi:lysophospholipase L1-like esterase